MNTGLGSLMLALPVGPRYHQLALANLQMESSAHSAYLRWQWTDSSLLNVHKTEEVRLDLWLSNGHLLLVINVRCTVPDNDNGKVHSVTIASSPPSLICTEMLFHNRVKCLQLMSRFWDASRDLIGRICLMNP